MDVSYSAWRHSTKESLVLKGDSFSFLFDRRYTNRLNRMSRVFFEAYSKATKELAAQEDRFPSLSEIDAKMESGAVYAFKDRLTKNTEFFEEIKISGVSYLVPRALRFVDLTGVYTDLVFDFDEGTVVLPTRRKVPAPVEAAAEPEAPSQTPAQEMSSLATETLLVASVPAAVPDMHPEEAPAVEAPPAIETAGPAPRIEEPLEEPEPPLKVEEPKITLAAVDFGQKPAFAKPPEKSQEPSFKVASPKAKVPEKGPLPAKNGLGTRAKPLILAVAALLVLMLAGYYILAMDSNEGETVVPPTPVGVIQYSAYLSNSSQNTSLGLSVYNPDGMDNQVELVLPQNIDDSISAMGGVVTIAHAENTFIRMMSNGDAEVNVMLNGNWTSVPVLLNLTVPDEFDASLAVHGGEYDLNRKNNSILLRFNCTYDGVVFEQTYTTKE